jgi:biotin operon repressor
MVSRDLLVHLTCKRPVASSKLCERFGVTRATLAKEIRAAQKDGFKIEILDGGFVATIIPQGPHATVTIGATKPGRYAVGQATDFHFGSEHCDLDAVREWAGRAWDRGVRSVVVTGDVLDGWKDKILVEQRAVGFDRQADEAVATIAGLPPFAYVAIDGNHDGYFSSAIGIVSGDLLARRMQAAGVSWQFAGVCLGRAVVHGARWHLWHPHGGASKRNTLRCILNERIEALREPADVVAMGHFHKFAPVFAYPENVLGVAGGTFQRKDSHGRGSEFARRITNSWDLGGPVVTYDLDRHGRVRDLAAEFLAVS